jgi:hypothetical protein
MWKTTQKPSVSFRQLCAIARRELETDPSIEVDLVEWKERIKDRVTRDGYQRPTTEPVYAAMMAVNAARRRQLERRLLRPPGATSGS